MQQMLQPSAPFKACAFCGQASLQHKHRIISSCERARLHKWPLHESDHVECYPVKQACDGVPIFMFPTRASSTLHQRVLFRLIEAALQAWFEQGLAHAEVRQSMCKSTCPWHVNFIE